jgi:hypothetical protein
MFEELGGLFGWLLVIAFVGTILNYCIKFVNKRFSKKLSGYPVGKKLMKILMTIFVRNHKYFGFATVILLLAHFIAQFAKFGINITGAIAAIMMIIQVLLGVYANIKKKPRRGTWFIAHQIIAVLIIIARAIHLSIHYALNMTSRNGNGNQLSDSVDTTKLKSYTLDELSKYNGKKWRIKKINNHEYQMLLELRYLSFKTWKKIAVEML